MSDIYYCPNCGAQMVESIGMMDVECPSCGAEGELIYNAFTKEYDVDLAESFSEADVLEDPIKNKPSCCKSCGGPYPDCMVSCKLFDD